MRCGNDHNWPSGQQLIPSKKTSSNWNIDLLSQVLTLRSSLLLGYFPKQKNSCCVAGRNPPAARIFLKSANASWQSIRPSSTHHRRRRMVPITLSLPRMDWANFLALRSSQQTLFPFIWQMAIHSVSPSPRSCSASKSKKRSVGTISSSRKPTASAACNSSIAAALPTWHSLTTIGGSQNLHRCKRHIKPSASALKRFITELESSKKFTTHPIGCLRRGSHPTITPNDRPPTQSKHPRR